MKSTEIIVGNDYAYCARLPRLGMHSVLGGDYPTRVRVVSEPSNGEVAVLLNLDDSKTVIDRTVSVRNLIATWSEHEDVRNRKDDQRSKEIERLRKNAKTVKNIVGRRAFNDLPYGFDGKVCNDGSFATGGRMSLEDLADLLSNAYEKGRADQRAEDA